MHLDLFALECFLAVVDSGGFTRAAKRLGRTQSAVSQQVGKLEALLERPLLRRGVSGSSALALTTEGEALLTYAKKMVQLQLEMQAHFLESEVKGKVTFGLPEDFASSTLSKVLVEFARLHPRVLLEVECDLTLNLLKRFRKKNSTSSCSSWNCLVASFAAASPASPSPQGVDLGSDPLEWVAAEGFQSRTLPEVLPLVLSPQPCVHRAKALAALERAGRKYRIVFSSPSFLGTVAAVEAGLGIAVFPRHRIPSGLQSLRKNRMHSSILPKLEDAHLSLLKKTGASRAAAVQTFEKFVLAHCKREIAF